MTKVMTLKEVAEQLHVDRHTLYRWINDGRLRAFKLAGGRFLRVREKDFEKFIREDWGPPRPTVTVPKSRNEGRKR